MVIPEVRQERLYQKIANRKKLRCVSRHQNPSMVNLRDGHLNLAQSGHYNFAVIPLVRIMYIMLNVSEHVKRRVNTAEIVHVKKCSTPFNYIIDITTYLCDLCHFLRYL